MNAIKLAINAEAGTVKRGKYTFPKIPALLINTLDVLLKEEAKKFQKVKPDKVKIGYGIPTVSNFAKLPKMIVKKIVEITG